MPADGDEGSGGAALPVVVFDMTKPGNIQRVLTGERVGTLVTAGEPKELASA